MFNISNRLLQPSALLVLLILLLVSVPFSIFGQASDDQTEADVETEIGGVDNEENDVIVIEAESEGVMSESQGARSGQSIDTYSREQLPNDTVYGDFVIGPGRFEIELAPGQSRTVELIISNRMGVGRVFSFNVEDMEASDRPDGAVQLLGDKEGPYTIRDFISVPHEEFYLEHATRARVPVTISLPPDAEPGGRYGSILTSIVSDPGLDEGTGTRVGSAIISRIGTLFFVTTPGDIIRDSKLTDFSTINRQTFFSTSPINFLVEVENFGSVHTTPYGLLTITNILGEEVGAVELQPWFVLPASVRTRQIEWSRELLVGRYNATVQIHRGYDNIVDELQYSFWVIPWKLLLVVFVGLFVFFMILRFLFSRFEFKRKA